MLSSSLSALRRGLSTATGVLAAVGCCAKAAGQEPMHDLALFVSVVKSHYSGISDDRFDEFEFTPTADMIYSRSTGSRRLLAEVLANDEEFELERFHVGWQLSEDTRVLLGRFHHSGTFWNTQYHHGAYLQSTITRPGIEEFEDFGGVLPMHVTGMLIEQRETFDSGSAVQFSFSTGLTSRLNGDELEPFDLLDPDSGFRPGIDTRITFLPDALGENQVGVSFGKHNVAVINSNLLNGFWDPGANEVELETIGLSLCWNIGRWKILANSLNVSAVARGGVDGSNHDFTATYMQAEYAINEEFSVHARGENTTGDEAYVYMFDRYIRRQSILGLRWNVAKDHALTFELTKGDSHHDRFSRATIQWSSVLR